MNKNDPNSGMVTNHLKEKMMIVGEIVMVFSPLYFGLVINNRIGTNHIPLWGDVVILGGPLVYIGLCVSCFILRIFSKNRGVSWGDYGLKKSKSWLRMILNGLAVSLAIFGVVALVINPVIRLIPNLEPRDMSRFEVLEGNLPTLLINLVLIWITAGFFRRVFMAWLPNE